MGPEFRKIHGLNPTYPGCSAVITSRNFVRRRNSTLSLNPTYPGCSAVMTHNIDINAEPGMS